MRRLVTFQPKLLSSHLRNPQCAGSLAAEPFNGSLIACVLWRLEMRVARLSLLVVAVASTLCFAQTLERGAVHGTIYDASHAVVANAKVTLSNSSTGFRREMTTTGDGGFTFEAVPP